MFTTSQIKKSIESGNLKLSGVARRGHFETVLWLVFISVLMPLLYAIDFIDNRKLDAVAPLESSLLYFTLIPLIFAVIFFVLQKRALQLTRITSQLSETDARQLIVQIARRNGWFVRNNRKGLMVVMTKARGFSWGERITLMFRDGNIWANSIYDPDHASIPLPGRNRAHLQQLQAALCGNRRLASLGESPPA